MKRVLFLTILISLRITAQTDYSKDWEDFYSYNNVKDFIKVGSNIYALADNAVFVYDVVSGNIEKLSSVHGLSGEETSSIYYSASQEKLVIGYKTGLLEIIDKTGKITIVNDIERLSISGEKDIRHISEHNDKLYLSTPFAIIVYDIEKLQFGDTYFIGNNSTKVSVNQTIVFNEKIYAATETGIFTADVDNLNLIDFNNWQHPQGEFYGNFKSIEVFNNEVFTCKDNVFYKINNTYSLEQVATFSEAMLKIKASQTHITVSTLRSAHIYNSSLVEEMTTNTTHQYFYDLNAGFAESGDIYLATDTYGILKRSFTNTIDYQEIHPEGPFSNDVFSITVQNDHLWVVYGGYDNAYTPLQRSYGYSHFNGQNWINIPFSDVDPFRDLVHVTVDVNNPEKIYISSWGQTFSGEPNATGGIVIAENDMITGYWNHTNSGLEDLLPNDPTYHSVRINGTAFDNQGNLWITNAWVDKRLKKLSNNGTWSSYDLSSIMTNSALGLNELVIDKSGSIWIGTRRNGVLVYNENGDRERALTTEVTKGSLPDPNARTLAVDRNNRIWIGTAKGLVVYSSAGTVFDNTIYDASPVIIDDDGIAKKLLGEQTVNSIAIDGADNKWFGTETGGVLATNTSGMETLFNFNKDNSPLPSNRILKVKVDDSNGKVFFATDKGIVAFNNNVSPYGDGLGEVYAYPNPVKKEHQSVTIDGRNGTHLPRGTNVKIVDSAGKLVYETNVVEGQELKGGKVVWNKTNLAGRQVASGVYIVLLTLPDRSETSITKIAVIN